MRVHCCKFPLYFLYSKERSGKEPVCFIDAGVHLPALHTPTAKVSDVGDEERDPVGRSVSRPVGRLVNRLKKSIITLKFDKKMMAMVRIFAHLAANN